MALYDGWDPPRPGWRCSECGFDYDDTDPAGAVLTLGALLPEYEARLFGDTNALRVRPDAATWSALEYGCHVRDCLALYAWRISRVVTEDRPELPQMHRDEVVVARAYNEQRPAEVVRDMATNHARLAEVIEPLGPEDWGRVGVREGDELSVAWMARNTVHEAVHHLGDIDRVLDLLARRGVASDGRSSGPFGT